MVRGFNGKTATLWNERYIDTFNEMETKLLVALADERIVVSSRWLAESFEKHHKDVLEITRGIKGENSPVTDMFFSSTYKASMGKNYMEAKLKEQKQASACKALW